MKKFIALAAVVLVSMATTTMYAQESRAEKRADRKAQRDAERARLKAEEQAQDAISYDDAMAALKAHQFVMEADQVMFRNGQTAFVNSNTNFVLVNQGRGTVQVAFNTVYPGPNGIGGVTVDGTVSDIQMTTDKRGNVNCNFSIQGIGISAQIFLTLTDGGNNATVTIEKGKTVALVGQSGSGKSTMVDLIPRYYDVQQGEVLIDGINVKDTTLHDLRSIMGNVNQEAILFNDTFYNNISFGVENATMEQVVEAAKIANAHDFIIASENGYDTMIGDRGGKLSGGQRQRISIARAILKNPPILILDEATSALDTESERMVQDALEKLMKNRTTIAIAHRLSTIRNADEICVLHEGRIVERGKHEDLLAMDGYYKKLCDMQQMS